jgi:hypothetical protein
MGRNLPENSSIFTDETGASDPRSFSVSAIEERTDKSKIRYDEKHVYARFAICVHVWRRESPMRGEGAIGLRVLELYLADASQPKKRREADACIWMHHELHAYPVSNLYF